MLVTLVACYFAATIGIGFYAARHVKNSADYLVAGRSLPLYMNTATVFATWFGAELILAVSSTFLKEGLRGVVGDPFGAAFCLIFVALFLAAPYYRLKLMTVGDFYKKRYNRTVELASAAAISISYLGWSSANLVALGIVIHTVSGNSITLEQGIIIGAVIVGIYTLVGGMWSVAFTDLFQTVIIVVGLLYIAWILADMAGGAGKVIETARHSNRLHFFPAASLHDWLEFLAAFITMALGSIAQQDVFQRVTSARNEKIAKRGTLLGGSFYLIMAFVPMFIAVSALLIDPAMVQRMLTTENDFQQVLPTLILQRTPLFAQVLFFGALLSAILSTASGTLLAPTAVITENVIQPLWGDRISDRTMLVLLRLILIGFTCCVTLFALSSDSSMYQMVQDAYKVTLVSAFTPLVFGLFWRKATPQGALLSMASGVIAWQYAEHFMPDTLIPPQLFGLGCAIIGMLIGSWAPCVIGGRGHPEIIDLTLTPNDPDESGSRQS
ncbi:MAG: sodium:solute symporter family protein [Lautropia sp.]|nr:sodium:solute symporter family protein [Lautropia sp.]